MASNKPLKFRKPMLAKTYEGHEHHVQYPCYVQPKIDGVRCITDGRRFFSRNGKEFPRANTAHLQVPRFSNLIDGELMLDEGTDFEDIVSTVKRAGHENSSRLMFYAFDVMSSDTFMHRRLQLRHLFECRQMRIVTQNWFRLTTVRVTDVKELRIVHGGFLDRGYEGTMIRNALGLYVPKHTKDLLKWKPLKDREFEILDVIEAKGKDAGTPIFICAVPNSDDFFRVRPMGTMKQRRRMWRARHRMIGKQLTVEYQNLTKYGVPRFPRAKVLRDYE